MSLKKLPKILILFAFVFVLCFGGQKAFAAEDSTEVKLPVVAIGVDCHAILLDEDGNELQTHFLKDGVTTIFTTNCKGIGVYNYKIKLTDKDTDKIIYDKTVYNVKVELYRDYDGKVKYVISADPKVGESGKPERLEFAKNVRLDLICKADPPVKKVIRGGDPLKKSVFDFVMKPLNKNNPMPEGSVDGVKYIHITGEGDNEFGQITFTEPGVYEYTAEEIDGGVEGYTYDKRIYTFRYVVTQESGNLICRTTVLVDGTEVDGITVATFINSYQPKWMDKIKKLVPKTGDANKIIMFAVIAGAALIGMVGMITYYFVSKKKKDKDNKDDDKSNDEIVDNSDDKSNNESE